MLFGGIRLLRIFVERDLPLLIIREEFRQRSRFTPPFCFTSSSRARYRLPPAGTSKMPVSLPSPSTTARTSRLCRRVRCAMLSASRSIETPAFTRRTLDWLRTSLLKGMSREGDSVIFLTFVICIFYDGYQETLSQLLTRREKGPLLLLSLD